MKSSWLTALFLIPLLFAVPAYAGDRPTSVHVVLSSDADPYQQFLRHFETNLDDSYQVDSSTLPASSALNLAEADIYLVIGTAATEAVFRQRIEKPVVSAMVTRVAWDYLTEVYPHSSRPQSGLPARALVIDQPLERYVALCEQILPNMSAIGTAIGPANVSLVEDYRRSTANTGVAINVASLGPQENPLHLIEPVVAASDVFLALPDQSEYIRSVAKWGLFLAYRHQKPVIGFTKKYLEAGALAAIYSTPQDIAAQAVEHVVMIGSGQSSQKTVYYPSRYQIGLNQHMARTFGINASVEVLKNNLEVAAGKAHAN